jgi:hypothetical protein
MASQMLIIKFLRRHDTCSVKTFIRGRSRKLLIEQPITYHEWLLLKDIVITEDLVAVKNDREEPLLKKTASERLRQN